jgi:hypothetical protein
VKRKALVPNEKKLSAEGRRRAFFVCSRGNKTAIELFLAGLGGWDAIMRRRMDDGKSNQD